MEQGQFGLEYYNIFQGIKASIEGTEASFNISLFLLQHRWRQIYVRSRQQTCFPFFMPQKSFNKPFVCVLYMDVLDTIIPDTEFNWIVVYRIPDTGYTGYRIVASLNITVRE